MARPLTPRLALNTLARDPSDPTKWIDVEHLIDIAIELGLDLIDVQLDRGFRSLEDRYLRSVQEKCQNCGIDIGYAGVGHGFLGAGEDDTGQLIGKRLSSDEMETRVAEVEQGIDAAVALGTPLIRVFAGTLPEATPNWNETWNSAVDAFQRIANYADNRGVLIGLHNHPPTVAPTGDDILRLHSDIGRPNVTIILDTGQWHGSPGSNLEGTSDPTVDFYTYMEQVAPLTTYVRAKIYRIDSGQETWLDYPRIFSILSTANYQGPISIVYENRDNHCSHQDALKLAVTYLRSLTP